ncbi:MAG: linear amide C-N hydrolase [Methylocystis sp.]|uniref:linear amide C-N hydrolase n=1 Tax=Methylocystis sp. TaxID=1911079 RepID=UPI003DA1D82A
MRKLVLNLLLGASLAFAGAPAEACTRILYETGDPSYIVGRTMDWMVDPHTDLWAFPRGMSRDGGVADAPLKWAAKHGSVISSFYNLASVDGINDAGLVANVLYLVEADYGDATVSKKPKLSIGAWAQYVLDHFATVAEAVKALEKEPFVLVAPDLPGGHKAAGHLSLADASGDSAIFEYIGGKLVIHHGPQYRVMTNSPPYAQQLAINAYWKTVGGLEFLPGTARASDRFARMSWNLDAAPKVKGDPVLATAEVFSLVRALSVPLGLADPKEPNIASTIWRTVSDANAKRYFFESSYSPSIFWVDLDKVLTATGGKPAKLDLKGHPTIFGEASDKFAPAEPFKFIGQ